MYSYAVTSGVAVHDSNCYATVLMVVWTVMRRENDTYTRWFKVKVISYLVLFQN